MVSTSSAGNKKMVLAVVSYSSAHQEDGSVCPHQPVETIGLSTMPKWAPKRRKTVRLKYINSNKIACKCPSNEVHACKTASYSRS